MVRGWTRRGGRKLIEVLPVDTDAALGAAHRLDAAIRPDFRRALTAGVGAIICLAVGSAIGDGIHARALHTKLTIIGLAVGFVVLGVLAVRSAANEVNRLVRARGGPSAGTTVRLLIMLFGYLIVLVSVLGMLAVPLGHLLVGGAITGVVIGIAAQQSLGNLFAGLVLLLARPFVVGQEIRVRSGALGGPFDGVVAGMDLLYTTIETDEGPVRIPNSPLLAAAIGPRPPANHPTAERPAVSADRVTGDQRVTDAARPPADPRRQDPGPTDVFPSPAAQTNPAGRAVTPPAGPGRSAHREDRPYGQPPDHDDRSQHPLRNPPRDRGSELGADGRAHREYRRRAPRG